MLLILKLMWTLSRLFSLHEKATIWMGHHVGPTPRQAMSRIGARTRAKGWIENTLIHRRKSVSSGSHVHWSSSGKVNMKSTLPMQNGTSLGCERPLSHKRQHESVFSSWWFQFGSWHGNFDMFVHMVDVSQIKSIRQRGVPSARIPLQNQTSLWLLYTFSYLVKCKID